MQVQKVGIYTNSYSTNKNQQSQTKNPITFGSIAKDLSRITPKTGLTATEAIIQLTNMPNGIFIKTDGDFFEQFVGEGQLKPKEVTEIIFKNPQTQRHEIEIYYHLLSAQFPSSKKIIEVKNDGLKELYIPADKNSRGETIKILEKNFFVGKSINPKPLTQIVNEAKIPYFAIERKSLPGQFNM